MPPSSTAEAIAKVKGVGPPDGIVADYRLRDGDSGMEAIRAVAEVLGRQPPSMIITGDTEPLRLDELRKAGVPVMHKPVQPQRMKTMLASLLDGDTQARS